MQVDRPTHERGGTSMLLLGILSLVLFLAAIVGAVGGAYAAHAELQQSADIAAAMIEAGSGDAPAERARQLARANGARSVRVEEVEGGTKLRIRVTHAAPKLYGITFGTELRAQAIAELPVSPGFDGGP